MPDFSALIAQICTQAVTDANTALSTVLVDSLTQQLQASFQSVYSQGVQSVASQTKPDIQVAIDSLMRLQKELGTPTNSPAPVATA